jgi:hypothetical protein
VARERDGDVVAHRVDVADRASIKLFAITDAGLSRRAAPSAEPAEVSVASSITSRANSAAHRRARDTAAAQLVVSAPEVLA